MPLDDLDLAGLIDAAEHLAETHRFHAWSPAGRRRLSAQLCGAQTGHIRSIAGRPIENVYSSSYT